MNINNVLIVGGGIGGLCTAIALRQAGVAVDVVEIQPQWRVYGVGIIQQNNVVREMQRLGVLERYLDAAWPFDSVSVHTLSGQQLASFPGQRLAGEQFPANVGISRLALHNVLCSTARELGVRLTTGESIDAFRQVDDAVEVSFSRGGQGRYDLLVGADGIYSRVRGMLYRSGRMALQLSATAGGGPSDVLYGRELQLRAGAAGGRSNVSVYHLPRSG